MRTLYRILEMDNISSKKISLHTTEIQDILVYLQAMNCNLIWDLPFLSIRLKGKSLNTKRNQIKNILRFWARSGKKKAGYWSWSTVFYIDSQYKSYEWKMVTQNWHHILKTLVFCSKTLLYRNSRRPLSIIQYMQGF